MAKRSSSGKGSSRATEFDDLVKAFRDLRQEVGTTTGNLSRFGGGLSSAAGAVGRGVGVAFGSVAGVLGGLPQVQQAQAAALNIGSNLALSYADQFVKANAQSGSDMGLVGRFRSFLGGVVAKNEARQQLADIAPSVGGDPEVLRTLMPIIAERKLMEQASRRAAEDVSAQYIASDAYKAMERLWEHNALRPR